MKHSINSGDFGRQVVRSFDFYYKKRDAAVLWKADCTILWESDSVRSNLKSLYLLRHILHNTDYAVCCRWVDVLQRRILAESAQVSEMHSRTWQTFRTGVWRRWVMQHKQHCISTPIVSILEPYISHLVQHVLDDDMTELCTFFHDELDRDARRKAHHSKQKSDEKNTRFVQDNDVDDKLVANFASLSLRRQPTPEFLKADTVRLDEVESTNIWTSDEDEDKDEDDLIKSLVKFAIAEVGAEITPTIVVEDTGVLVDSREEVLKLEDKDRDMKIFEWELEEVESEDEDFVLV